MAGSAHESFDPVVVGSGPNGQNAAVALAQQAEIANEFGIVCMCHGDSRLDNVAFDPSGDGVYRFDWQLSFKNIGPTDISYFLGGSLPVDLRREKEAELVRIYHDALCARGVTNLSFATCWDLYRLGHLYYLCYMTTGGTETDVENERSFELFQIASHRKFTAALDHNSVEIIDPSYAIAR